VTVQNDMEGLAKPEHPSQTVNSRKLSKIIIESKKRRIQL